MVNTASTLGPRLLGTGYSPDPSPRQRSPIVRGFDRVGLTAVGGIACLLILAACSSSAPTPQERFVEEFIEGALPDASEFQAAILQDGQVEFEEYERSVFATLACLDERGLEIFGPSLDSDGFTYSYGYRGRDEAGDLLPDSVVNGIFNFCYSSYGELVDSVWFAQKATSFFDAPQELKQAYISCFALHGIELEPDVHITEIYRILAEDPSVEECSAAES